MSGKKEKVWNSNGENPIEWPTRKVERAIAHGIVKRNDAEQAVIADGWTHSLVEAHLQNQGTL